MKKPRTAVPPIGKGQPAPRKRRSHPIYHTNRWRRESRQFLSSTDGLCVMCKDRGILTEATTTDHIIPLEVCNDPWDHTNWQPSCPACNREKGRTTDKKVIAEHRKNQPN